MPNTLSDGCNSVPMSALIDNLLNGNLKAAKHLAKRFPTWQIREYLQSDYGYSIEKANLTADWLKGRDCYQAACDAN